MYSLVRVIGVIFIFLGSTATSSAADSVEVSSQQTETSNFNIIDLLSSLNVTENGLWNITEVTENLKSLNQTSILSTSIDLKELFQNFSLTDYVKDFLASLNFTSLIENITSSGSLTTYLYSTFVKTSEDGLLDFKGLANKYMGSVEEYNVTTEDGYILKVFRIPGDTSKVVLISHGFLSSADDFILRGETSLVYILAQSGYDVWVMNYRGNRYSRNHQTLNPDTDEEFWQYSLQEFGYYDLSAVIDFALNKTGQQMLSVVGHSEGAASVFVLTSTRPEYNDKIKIFIALSPVCYLSDTSLAWTLLVRYGKVISDTLTSFGIHELIGFESNARKLFQLVCSQGQVGYELCGKGVFGALFGYNPDNLEPDFLTSVLGHLPAGSSVKNFLHYTQIGNNDRFAQFDYGSNNTEIYGSEIPPLYDFQKVTCNVALFGSKNDALLGMNDFNRVKEEVLNLVNSVVIDDEKFTHADYLYGWNATEVLYKQVIDELIIFN